MIVKLCGIFDVGINFCVCKESGDCQAKLHAVIYVLARHSS